MNIMVVRKKHSMDKIGFTCSCFDLLHTGHILMLKDAKEQCDYLIVGLQTDPTLDRPEKNKPIQSLEERKIQLEELASFEQCFITGTAAEVTPVSEIDNFKFRVGEEIKILSESYINLVNNWKGD